MKDELLSRIEHELLQAESASQTKDFEKHMYAIETLARLAQESSGESMTQIKIATVQPEVKAQSKISEAELKAMGANLAKTDDGLGNGASIFEF